MPEMPGWRATFRELRLAEVTLAEWLAFHWYRRSMLTDIERKAEA